MAPSSVGAVRTNKKKQAPVAANDPIVGMRINKCHSIGSFLGEGAFGKVYTVKDDRNGNDKEWAVKIVPHSSVTVIKTKKNHASTPSDRLHYEQLMYTQQLRHLCGTVLPNLPTNHLHQLNCFYPSICSDNRTASGNSGTFTCWFGWILRTQFQKNLTCDLRSCSISLPSVLSKYLLQSTVA